VTTVLEISDELAQEIWQEAKTQGLSVEDFLKLVLRRERTLANRRKIEQEQDWWFRRPLSERAKYEGKFVAIHNQSLIDYDQDEEVLYQRVRESYGKTAVLIMPADGPREIQIFSPRILEK